MSFSTTMNNLIPTSEEKTTFVTVHSVISTKTDLSQMLDTMLRQNISLEHFSILVLDVTKILTLKHLIWVMEGIVSDH